MADDVMNYGDLGWDDCDPKPFGINLMAKHLKDLWDGIQVWIRIDPTDLKERYDDPAFWPGGAGKIRPFNQYIDAVITQYSRAVSTPAYSTRYATVQQSAADALGMDMVCGLNIADGGNGSSGQEGWRGPGFYTMTPTEVSWHGKNLITNSDCKYMLLWEFDGNEIWPDGTIGGEYFEADVDYKDSILRLRRQAHHHIRGLAAGIAGDSGRIKGANYKCNSHSLYRYSVGPRADSGIEGEYESGPSFGFRPSACGGAGCMGRVSYQGWNGST